VPFGTGAHGLPVGVQVLAPTLGEPVMFRVAAELERAAARDDQRAGATVGPTVETAS
jgi:Asp-tRNA(Asn)/Glu-tRNA(Gln) amidotransferase A subunit family amidase